MVTRLHKAKLGLN